jgi:nucleoside-diphosphate-sugar epimerase
VSLRNATAYGWSPRLRCDIVLNDLVAGAFLTGAITVLSDGTPWRPIVHIADISAAFAAALDAPRDAIHAEAINVGSAEDNHQVSGIAKIVADAVPSSELRITGETGSDPRSYRVDFTKLGERLPEFQPAWDARRGAKELYDAFQQHGLDEHAYRHTFKRLPTLLRLRDEGVVDSSLRRCD